MNDELVPASIDTTGDAQRVVGDIRKAAVAAGVDMDDAPILVVPEELVTFLIPECCREGWEDCPHVVNRPTKPARRNIAL